MAVVIGEPSVEDPKVALSHHGTELETYGGNELTAAGHLTIAGGEMANALDLLHQALGALGAFKPEADQAQTGHNDVASGVEDLAPKLATNVRTSPNKDAHDAVRRTAGEVEPSKEDKDAIKGYVDLGESVVGMIKKAIKKIEDARAVPAITTTAQRMTERGGNMKKDAEVLKQTARDW
jgi:hypothetical protein